MTVEIISAVLALVGVVAGIVTALAATREARRSLARIGAGSNSRDEYVLPRATAFSRPPVQPIPEGYRSVTPYLQVDDATQAIEYYEKAFGARERVRMEAPDGRIGHAELEIGDSLVMLSDPFPQSPTKPPKELGGTSASIFMYVEDVDAVVRQAVDAGATVTMEVADQFWGDRFGSITDPFGHLWSIATHFQDVAPEEVAERARAAAAARTPR